MEAFGRVIAVCLASAGIFLVIFCGRRTVLFRQKERMVQSMVRECAKGIMDTRLYSVQKIEDLERQLERLGEYSVECTVFLRVFYETEEGRMEQYRICEEESANLSVGSFLRIRVTEKRTNLELFLYGSGVIVLAGGKVL